MPHTVGFPSINLATNKNLAQMVALVQDYMRDDPRLNRLIVGEETSPRMVAYAVLFTIDRFNSTPPLFQQFGVENFPSAYLLLTGSVSHVLKSAGILQMRNQMDYSAGGVSVAHSNKSPMYQAWASMYDSEWLQASLSLKVALNIENAYGRSIPSEYLLINGFFGDFL